MTTTITETDDTILDKSDGSPQGTLALYVIADEPELTASTTACGTL